MKNEDESLANRIAKDISTQIIIGELNPGDKLVEKHYADQYGTSRAPVREALYILTTEGLLQRIPRRGAVVKKYSNTDIYDLLEIRNMLELMAIKRMKDVGKDEKILQEMRSLIEQMDVNNAIYSYTKLNHAFHSCIVKMSKSTSVIETYTRLGAPLLRIQNLSFSKEGNIQKSITEHEKIYTLINEEAFDTLKPYLADHNDYVISSVKELLN